MGSDVIAQVRCAYPTGSLENIERFYGQLLGLPQIGSFARHEGYAGIMFGLPDARVHLEFTQVEHEVALPQWSVELLLVLYIPEKNAYAQLVAALQTAGVPRVLSENPYWERGGSTFLDPDGRRVVIYNGAGLSS